jgi:hypothetical protein
MEFRDLDAAKVDHLWKGIESRFKQTDKEENVETHCELLDENAPARSDAAIQSAIRDAANSEPENDALAEYFILRAKLPASPRASRAAPVENKLTTQRLQECRKPKRK